MLGPQRVGVVAAEDEVALTAADAALRLGIAIPVLIGDERKTRMKLDALELSALTARRNSSTRTSRASRLPAWHVTNRWTFC